MVQSSATRLRHRPVKGKFRICVIGHLREEKDPLRTLLALPFVPSNVRLEVIHLGAALDPRSFHETTDPRYRWLGSVPHARALRWLASSHAMVISSRMEGGANVVCEALRIGVPVLASRIPGNVGLLGSALPGIFSGGGRARSRPADDPRGDRRDVLSESEKAGRKAEAYGSAAGGKTRAARGHRVARSSSMKRSIASSSASRG